MKKKRKRKRQASSRDEPTGLGDIIATLKKTTSLGRQIEQAQIWDHWEQLVGEPYWRHGRPRTLKDGRLTVEADSAVWMHKFTYRKWELIKRINRRAGHEMVSDIFVTLVTDEEPFNAQDTV